MGTSAEIRRGFYMQRSDPERLWIRFVPRRWPAASHWNTDLSPPGAPRRAARAVEGFDRPPDARVLQVLDDLLWLPAVNAEARPVRDEWLLAGSQAGVPVLSVVGASEEVGAGLAVVDLFQVLVSNEWSLLADRATAETAIWPLVGGWSDGPGIVDEGLRALRGAGFRTVVGVRAELDPRELRELGERVLPEGGERLFHAPPPDRRTFARAVVAASLNPWLDRPLPTGPPHVRRNRRLGGVLLRIAELSQTLGRPELEAQAYYRAARWIDDAAHDVSAVVAEGNLGIVQAIEPSVRLALEEYQRAGHSPLLQELEAEYLAEPSELDLE